MCIVKFIGESGMQLVILAGGLGTRISTETYDKPKPMISIGGMPILWHIMKLYSKYGVNDFIICLGYRGHVIKEFFHDYFMYANDFQVDFSTGSISYINQEKLPWKVTLIDTGANSNTGGRLARVASYIKGNDFCLTYGDGLADVDIVRLLAFHASHGKLATVTSVVPSGRFGALITEGNMVVDFQEKPSGDSIDNKGRVNGGFFVFNRQILNQINSDDTSLEAETLVNIAATQQLMAYQHDGFWQPIDAPRDLEYMRGLWERNQAPWKIW